MLGHPIIAGLIIIAGPFDWFHRKANTDLDDAIVASQHRLVRPPSTLAPPGTLLALTKAGTGEVVEVVCNSKYILGGRKPRESNTLATETANKLNGSFGLDVSALERGGGLKLDGVREVQLTLSNVKIVALSDRDVAEAAKKKDKLCMSLIRDRRKKGDQLTIVRSVLEADAQYTIVFDASVNAAARLGLIDQLKAKFHASGSDSAHETLRATGLYFGFRDDAWLVRLAEGAAGAAAQPPPEPILPLDGASTFQVAGDARR